MDIYSQTPTFIIFGVKGGIGKSVVSVNVGIRIDRFYATGLIDADIDSSNTPEILQLKEDMTVNNKTKKLVPIRYQKRGMKVFSMGVFHSKGTKASTHEGTENADIIKEALTSVMWGNVKAFVIDLCAGSSDELRIVLDYLKNLKGFIVVAHPNAREDFLRCVTIASMEKVPIIGVVENMHGARTHCCMLPPVCPKCEKEYQPFGQSQIQTDCETFGIEYFGSIPLIGGYTDNIKDGQPLIPKSHSEAIDNIIAKLKQIMEEDKHGRT